MFENFEIIWEWRSYMLIALGNQNLVRKWEKYWKKVTSKEIVVKIYRSIVEFNEAEI